jgi:hypothetical protein
MDVILDGSRRNADDSSFDSRRREISFFKIPGTRVALVSHSLAWW